MGVGYEIGEFGIWMLENWMMVNLGLCCGLLIVSGCRLPPSLFLNYTLEFLYPCFVVSVVLNVVGHEFLLSGVMEGYEGVWRRWIGIEFFRQAEY